MKKSTKVIGAGAGLAALVAAGTYFLYGPRGAKNRAKISGWVLKVKGEVLEKMEDMKEINQEAYEKLVDETAQRYARVKHASASEIKHVTAELKSAWSHISKQLK